MVVKIENVNGISTGKCQSLSGLTIQGLYSRQGYNSSEYVVQYSPENRIYRISWSE